MQPQKIKYISNCSYFTITNSSGTIVEERDFDAWGRTRDAYTLIHKEDIEHRFRITDRGFMGHEHLYEFRLINMNGRMYDPVLARFLSPDNYVQDATSTQSYNRFAYVWNNPLKYTDPEGEWVHLVIGAFIGGTINWIAYGTEFNAKGLGYFGVGALAGALSAGIGAGVGAAIAGNAAAGSGFAAGFLGTATISSTGFVAGAAVGAIAGFTNGFITGTGNGLLGNQNIVESLLGGLDAGWKQGLTGGVTGGVLGGIHAAKNGRDFWTGGYKTHKIPESPLLASIDEGGVVVSEDGEVFYTVKNQSGETIYYKPDDDIPLKGIKGDGAYPLKNGRGLVDPVDGVTAPGRTGEVFKVTDPFSYRATGVTVYDKTVLVEPRAFWPIPNDFNSVLGGGWLSSPPDAGWNAIFKMSGYIFR